jgi:hypothetical protein
VSKIVEVNRQLSRVETEKRPKAQLFSPSRASIGIDLGTH